MIFTYKIPVQWKEEIPEDNGNFENDRYRYYEINGKDASDGFVEFAYAFVSDEKATVIPLYFRMRFDNFKSSPKPTQMLINGTKAYQYEWSGSTSKKDSIGLSGKLQGKITSFNLPGINIAVSSYLPKKFGKESEINPNYQAIIQSIKFDKRLNEFSWDDKSRTL